ncbi:MAG: hypothetical protein KDK70_09140, partial [Myxococcales bacterium]|nr:hypothetical protein [Myxococcales bacterium]
MSADLELSALLDDVVRSVDEDIAADPGCPDLAAVIARAHELDPQRVPAEAVHEVAQWAPVVSIQQGHRRRRTRDDVELLAARFVAARSATEGGPALELTDEARMALREHRWPGNVRELRNVIQRAISLAHGSRILEADLALHDQGDLMAVEELLTLPYREAHSQLDRYYLRRVMAETRGNITHAAERLGTSRRSLRERLKKLGLVPQDLGPTPKLEARMAELRRRLAPDLPWIRG